MLWVLQGFLLAIIFVYYNEKQSQEEDAFKLWHKVLTVYFPSNQMTVIMLKNVNQMGKMSIFSKNY